MELDLRALAIALSGRVDGGQVLAPGPGHSVRDRSMAVRPSVEAPDGFVVHSHAGDDWRACRDHVLSLLGCARVPSHRQNSTKSKRPSGAQSHDRSECARALWHSAIEPRGTLAEKYLNSRKLELPEDAANVVRFLAMCPWREDGGNLTQRPVMLAAFRSIITDEIVAVHRTLLSDNARKIDRRMLGSVAGAAIKIDCDHSVELGLHICEGFETGLAGRMLGFRPCWTLGSSGSVARFPVLNGIETLTILAETDEANERAVDTCGERWLAAGCEVFVATPSETGDMNDVLLRRHA